jgi:hypothetical protein
MSCDSDLKWVGELDSKKDEKAVNGICGTKECGHTEYEFRGKTYSILCGECADGYECVSNDCKDINECAEKNGGCKQICKNTDGGRACECEKGYDLATDGKDCEDIDECKTNNGGCDQICKNIDGGRTCDCNQGYILGDDNTTCDDIDECSDIELNTCSEFADCFNKIGDFSCECRENYSGDGKDCVADTRTQPCTGLAENTEWNTVSNIIQTWDGTKWVPSTTGIYSVTPSNEECRFKCEVNYSWSGSSCVADTKIFNCSLKPAGSVWNTVSEYTQTWNGTEWVPSESSTEYNATPANDSCRYKCAENYTWNGSACVADTKANQACTGLPTDAAWNTTTNITQTWNGFAWMPSTVGLFNATPSTIECRFKCNTNYTWNPISETCVADVKANQACTGLPANAAWNTATNITQTWSGSVWLPTTVGGYNESSSTAECRFNCNTNYTWNSGSSTCVADTKADQACTGLPTNATWNTATTIDQLWDGSEWVPSTTGLCSVSSSTTECRFKCNVNYSCDISSTDCVADTKVNQACTGLPTNAAWNTATNITQTWSGSAWLPTTVGVQNITPSTAECRFKCNTNYTWNSGSSTCVADTKDAQACTGLPTNAFWNTATTIDQLWDGSEWVPSTTGLCSVSSSTTECRFKCNVNYSCDISSTDCVADTKKYTCPEKPDNTDWNSVSEYTQTWSGSEWLPIDDTITDYSISASTTECSFKCGVGYRWNGVLCALIIPRTICTGQSVCYNGTEAIACSAEGSDYYGQDYQYKELGYCFPRDYTVSGTAGADVVTDNNTGLIWQRALPATYSGCAGGTPAGSECTWQKAIDYCDGLDYAGQTDWRLPSRQELSTIPDYGSYNPAIDETMFPDIPLNDYWTRSSCVSDTAFSWYVSFYNGGVFHGGKTYSNHVRCVRGSVLPVSSFAESTVGGKVIVTDILTGLVWQKEYSNNVTWGDALSYCEDSNYAGYTDWRLPNINEIKMLTNDAFYNPASSFPGMPSQYFWSSSSYVGVGSAAMGVNFGSDFTYVGGKSKSDSSYARCVR